MKTLIVVLFMHFVVVNGNSFYYQRTNDKDCKFQADRGNGDILGSPMSVGECKSACDADSQCNAYQYYKEDIFTTKCLKLRIPDTFDKSTCLTESGWHFFERIHDCPYYVLHDPASASKECPDGDNIEDEDECRAFYESKQAELPDKTANWFPCLFRCQPGTAAVLLTVLHTSQSCSTVTRQSNLALVLRLCRLQGHRGLPATSGGNCHLYYRQGLLKPQLLKAATSTA